MEPSAPEEQIFHGANEPQSLEHVFTTISDKLLSPMHLKHMDLSEPHTTGNALIKVLLANPAVNGQVDRVNDKDFRQIRTLAAQIGAPSVSSPLPSRPRRAMKEIRNTIHMHPSWSTHRMIRIPDSSPKSLNTLDLSMEEIGSEMTVLVAEITNPIQARLVDESLHSYRKYVKCNQPPGINSMTSGQEGLGTPYSSTKNLNTLDLSMEGKGNKTTVLLPKITNSGRTRLVEKSPQSHGKNVRRYQPHRLTETSSCTPDKKGAQQKHLCMSCTPDKKGVQQNHPGMPDCKSHDTLLPQISTPQIFGAIAESFTNRQNPDPLSLPNI